MDTEVVRTSDGSNSLSSSDLRRTVRASAAIQPETELMHVANSINNRA